VLTENNSSRKERCRSKKSRENILLRASENSMRWSSVCWIGVCWRSSCTAFSEWKRVSESLNLLSGSEHGKLASPFPWGSYQKGGINLIQLGWCNEKAECWVQLMERGVNKKHFLYAGLSSTKTISNIPTHYILGYFQLWMHQQSIFSHWMHYEHNL
jgi:hypothetical protein